MNKRNNTIRGVLLLVAAALDVVLLCGDSGSGRGGYGHADDQFRNPRAYPFGHR